MNKKIFVALLAVVFFGLTKNASANIMQGDDSYLSPPPPYSYVANTFQSLGKGLVGTISNIQLRARAPHQYNNELTFFFLQCDRDLWGFDVNIWDFGCTDIAGTFYVRPDENGYINQPVNIPLNPSKYYAIFFYQDWQIYGSINPDSYVDGGMGSHGSPNSYDDVGDIEDAYFNLRNTRFARVMREDFDEGF